ncbi:MAG: metal-dependent hydrolase [Bacteroidota bacterium]
MKLTYYGHSCFSIETMGKTVLFDPFISGNELAKDVDIQSIKSDFILLSHGHQDHVHDTEAIAKQNDAFVVAPYEVAVHFQNKGLNGHPMNHGGKWQLDFGMTKMVNAVHSSVMPDGSYGGNPVGFVIWNEEACFYYAGDTALTWDMKLIPMTCPKLDFAILPIGDNFTMGYEDAILASNFIECDRIIGVHYDTFGYIKIDQEAAQKAFADKGKSLHLPGIGESIEL